jgi:hypothetical protein
MKNDRRIYYHNILKKTEPDYENMAAYLLDEAVVFIGSVVDKCDNQECAGLFININDYFVPAADSEPVTYSELPKLYELYKKKKDDGVAQFVADKRGVPNIHWRDKGSNFQKPKNK